jgi:hypothetical protein
VETRAVEQRWLGVELSTWTDPGDTAWLLLEPAYSPASRRDGLILGLAHRRLAIRPTPCRYRPGMSDPLAAWARAPRLPRNPGPAQPSGAIRVVQRLTPAQRQWAARRARRAQLATALSWLSALAVAALCAGAVYLSHRAGGVSGAVAGAASIVAIVLLLERWATRK